MKQKIAEVCNKFNVIYMEVVNKLDWTKDTYGNFDELPYKGLYLNLLGDCNKFNNLLQMFEKEDELYTWKQGNMVALCFQTQISFICIFYCSEKKGLEAYQYSQVVLNEFKQLIS